MLVEAFLGTVVERSVLSPCGSFPAERGLSVVSSRSAAAAASARMGLAGFDVCGGGGDARRQIVLKDGFITTRVSLLWIFPHASLETCATTRGAERIWRSGRGSFVPGLVCTQGKHVS